MFTAIKDHVIQIGGNFKSCFGLILQGRFKEGFKEIGYAQEEIFYWIGFGFALSEILSLMLRSDISRRKKILPIIGFTLVALFSLFAGLILFGMATAFIPFLVIISALISFADTTTRYFSAKAEHKALQKLMNKENYKNLVKGLQERVKYEGVTPLADKITTLLEKDHFDKREIEELFARIGIRCINDSSEAYELLTSPTEDEKTKKAINNQLGLVFKDKYEPLCDFFAKKQQFHYLNKNLNRMYFNMWFFGLAFLFTILTASLPLILFNITILSNGPLICSALAALTVSVWTLGTLNRMRVIIQQTLSQNKIAKSKEELKASILPEKKGEPEGVELLLSHAKAVPTFWGNLYDGALNKVGGASRKLASWKLEAKAKTVLKAPWQAFSSNSNQRDPLEDPLIQASEDANVFQEIRL